jgi:hypothetical protein
MKSYSSHRANLNDEAVQRKHPSCQHSLHSPFLLTAKAVVATITEVGITSGSTMPGSPTDLAYDYIIFNGSNFNSNVP